MYEHVIIAIQNLKTAVTDLKAKWLKILTLPSRGQAAT